MPVGGESFSSVRKARQALRERAHELLNEYIQICKQAAAAGDYETAQKGMQYLMAHIKDDDGVSIVEMDVDKPKQVESGPKGPGIVIGVQIGGLNQKELPQVEVIDVTRTDQDPTTNS